MMIATYRHSYAISGWTSASELLAAFLWFALFFSQSFTSRCLLCKKKTLCNRVNIAILAIFVFYFTTRDLAASYIVHLIHSII